MGHENTPPDTTVFETLRLIAQYCHEQLGKAHRDYIKATWGLKAGILDSQLVGYLPPHDTEKLLKSLSEDGIAERSALETGFFYKREGRIISGFRGRFLFWYWEQGLPRYAIGRRTEHTPKVPRSGNFEEQGKYKKLTTRSSKAPYISPLIKNRIFNADAVKNNKQLIVAEGIADALALMQAGFNNVVSPVTIRFSKADARRLKEIL